MKIGGQHNLLLSAWPYKVNEIGRVGYIRKPMSTYFMYATIFLLEMNHCFK